MAYLEEFTRTFQLSSKMFKKKFLLQNKKGT